MAEEKVADLVLEGGGVKGIGLVGACSVLEEAGYRFNRIAGTTLDLVKAMVATMTGFHDQIHMDEECVLKRLIFVDSLRVKATDFDLDEMTQQQLFQNGRTGAVKFLSGWDFEKYIAECR